VSLRSQEHHTGNRRRMKGRPKRKADLGKRGDRLIVSSMKILLNKVLPNLKLPSDGDMLRLSLQIDSLRSDLDVKDLHIKAHEQISSRLKAIQTAQEELAKYLPTLQDRRDFHSRLIPDAGTAAIQGFERLRDAVEVGEFAISALSVLESMSDWIPPGVHGTAPRPAWPDYLDRMIGDFRAAVEQRNPKIGWKPSNGTGWVNLYLAAIIPHVTGERPTAVAVNAERRKATRLPTK